MLPSEAAGYPEKRTAIIESYVLDETVDPENQWNEVVTLVEGVEFDDTSEDRVNVAIFDFDELERRAILSVTYHDEEKTSIDVIGVEWFMPDRDTEDGWSHIETERIDRFNMQSVKGFFDLKAWEDPKRLNPRTHLDIPVQPGEQSEADDNKARVIGFNYQANRLKSSLKSMQSSTSASSASPVAA